MKDTKIKFISTAFAALLLAACGGDKADQSTADAAQEKHIRIATESNFKPFSYIDNQGELVGFEIDLAHALCEEMKVTNCEISSQDWDGLIPGLNADKFDAVMAGMSITEERQKAVDFSEPYFDNKLILIGKKGVDVTLESLAKSNGQQTVATQQGTVSVDYLQANHPSITIKTYDNQDKAYLDLVAGRADAMLSDFVPASDWLKTEQGQNFEIKGDVIDTGDKVGIAVRKGDALKAEFDAALAKLKESGKYDQINNKYFQTKAQ